MRGVVGACPMRAKGLSVASEAVTWLGLGLGLGLRLGLGLG